MGAETQGRVVRADAAARAQRAWELRVEGHDWEHIAEVVGFTEPSNAARAVRNYLGSLPQPDLAQVREELRGRLRWLWQQTQDAIERREPGALRAGTAVLQRWSQLEGADAPTRVQITPDAAEFERAVALLTERNRQQLDSGGEADIWDESDIVDAVVVSSEE